MSPRHDGNDPTGPTAPTTARVTAEDVVRSIEMILGRTPEPELVEYHLALGFQDRFALGAYMISTAEFRARYITYLGNRGVEVRPVSVFLGDRVLTLTHRGERIYLVPTDVDLTPPILLGGRYEPHVEDTILRCLRPGDRVIDVGANVGYHTVAMAAAVGAQGHIDAFEANPRVFGLLRATMFVNGFDWVSLYGKAVLDRAGSVTLASAPTHSGSGHIVLDEPASDYRALYSERVEVEAVTLDAELADLERVDLIHLDIEGAEPFALHGCEGLIERSPAVKIVTEWSVGMMGARVDVSEYADWLVRLGFRFWLIEPSGLLSGVAPEALPRLPHCDLLLSREDSF